MGMLSLRLLRRRLLLLDLHQLDLSSLRGTNLNLFFGDLLRQLFVEGDGVIVIGMTMSRWQIRCFPLSTLKRNASSLRRYPLVSPFSLSFHMRRCSFLREVLLRNNSPYAIEILLMKILKEPTRFIAA